MDISKRTVTLNDSDLILEWRNSVDARRNSQRPEKISQYEHMSWLSSRILRVPYEPFWIMHLGEKNLGYVRLDYHYSNKNIFTISIFVVPECRKAGFGKLMLATALHSVAINHPHSFFRAVVKKDNYGSVSLFQSLGFKYRLEIDSEFTEYELSAREIIQKCD